jgi:two-component system cell cycle sensor histidine kinase/response regulator CckA
MIPAEKSPNEAKRIEALIKYALLDTLPEEALDDLTAMAAQICGTPMALISLVDENRQWFKSRINFEASETPRSVSFCAHAIRQSDILIIPDATKDPRFADNPGVTGNPHIRFYAGAQLVSPEGAALGTLCVLDQVARTLTPVQEQVLKVLARQVMTHLELRRKTSELVEREEQLRLVTSQARVGLVVVDRERRYTYANKAYCEILGLSSDIVGSLVEDVLRDVYEEQVRPHADRAFAGELVEYELCRNGHDGDHYYAVRYQPVWVNGVVTLAVVVITDLTAYKRLEESLRLSHERFQLVARATNDAIWDWNLLNDAIWWNEGYQTLFGYSPEETSPGIDSWKLNIHPEDFDRVWNGIQQTIHVKVHSWSDEYRFRRQDGSYAWIFDRGYLIFDAQEKPVRMIGAMQDISHWKEAERQIEEQAALLDQTRDAIFVRTLEGKILFWSKGAERTYGWKREEVINRNIAEVLYVDAARFEEINEAVLKNGDWSGEARHRTKGNEELVIEARSTLVRDKNGHPKSVIAINTDVTEKKKIEAQFLRAQRVESIGTLAGGIAHDLNNILTPIMLSLEILSAGAPDPRTSRTLETLKVSARRGADIVRQVLSFARGMEGQRVEIQPRHLVSDLKTIIADTFPKDLRFEMSIPDRSWTVQGDPTQLHQVLLNLCVNARDAMPEGGLLSIAVENVTIDSQYAGMHIKAQPGRYVVFTVTDTGTGIPPEVLEKIFEPFFTTKELGRGTGLGLSTAMAIIKSHSGFVNVYSEPGNGTTFKVYLPALEESAEAIAETGILSVVPRGQGETILVIDDESSILIITAQTLEAFGYRALTANDGTEAVTIYAEKKNKIAAVLTDMSMPIMNGPATIRALRKINPALKIIAASGLKTNGSDSQISSLGIKDFLVKPYTAETLLKAVRKVLDRNP